MEGWLMKKNQRGVEWWKKRYFVLRGHGLSYYVDETEAGTDKRNKDELNLAVRTRLATCTSCRARSCAPSYCSTDIARFMDQDWTFTDTKEVTKRLGRKNSFELQLNQGVVLAKGQDTCYSLHPLDKASEMKWKVILKETIEDAKNSKE